MTGIRNRKCIPGCAWHIRYGQQSIIRACSVQLGMTVKTCEVMLGVVYGTGNSAVPSGNTPTDMLGSLSGIPGTFLKVRCRVPTMRTASMQKFRRGPSKIIFCVVSSCGIGLDLYAACFYYTWKCGIYKRSVKVIVVQRRRYRSNILIFVFRIIAPFGMRVCFVLVDVVLIIVPAAVLVSDCCRIGYALLRTAQQYHMLTLLLCPLPRLYLISCTCL